MYFIIILHRKIFHKLSYILESFWPSRRGLRSQQGPYISFLNIVNYYLVSKFILKYNVDWNSCLTSKYSQLSKYEVVTLLKYLLNNESKTQAIERQMRADKQKHTDYEKYLTDSC